MLFASVSAAEQIPHLPTGSITKWLILIAGLCPGPVLASLSSRRRNRGEISLINPFYDLLTVAFTF